MPTTLRESKPTARKAHRCSLCLGTIQRGEQYRVFVNVYEGNLYRWKECLPCGPVGALLWKQDLCDSDGYNEDDAYEWARDCAGHPVGLPDEEVAMARAFLVRRGITLGAAIDGEATP